MASAFAALVSIQQNLLAINTIPSHSFSFDEEQLESLWETVADLIDFMECYDNRYGARKEAAEALEKRIARAAQAADDVFESHIVDQICGGKTRSCFLLDLQKAIEDLDYVRRKATNVRGPSGTDVEEEEEEEEEEEQKPTYSSTPALTSSKTTKMVGFDDVLVNLLDQLTGDPTSRRVIPIIGMGGIGKTTLAAHAFKHSLILEYFDVCLWATVSQQFSIKKILTQLLYEDESTSGSVDELGEHLYKSLCGLRYLIILDDMWNLRAWDQMKFFFPDTESGSRIIVTTRHSYVAKQLSALCFVMSFMDENKSWDLFCQRAFVEQDCPLEMEGIGKKIVEKCKGLPLTIVVVGGHLRNSLMTLEYWENVAKHMNFILDSTESENCLNALSLSYSYLPVHLKPCFLLIGAFSEDQWIYVSDVVKLWIAEGFIEMNFDEVPLEEVAEHYLWELFERNLILVNESVHSGEFHKIKLHDLVREFCIKTAKKEDFLYVLDSPQAISRERRVVINGEVPPVNHQRDTVASPIRCLICEGGRLTLTHDLKLLRVLNKVDSASTTSESIFQQVNLRYLAINLVYKCRRVHYLPSSISRLWNLQTLVITVASLSKVIAPYEIWEMLQLRHLEVDPICLLDPFPIERLDERNELILRKLDTLLRVENFRLSAEVCKRIPHVRKLELSYCDERNSSYYCPHNLGSFQKLEYLVCQFHGNSKWRQFALSLTFPTSLKSLYLSGCGVDWEELTVMVGSLPHLVTLRLYADSVVGSEWTPLEEKFLCLKNLEISGCDDLIHWNADSFNFPVLQTLILRKLSKLDDFPSGIGEIPTLRWYRLECCSFSSSISAMETLVEQEEQGNEDLLLSVYFQGDAETLESFKEKVREDGLSSSKLHVQFRNLNRKSP